MSETTHCRFGCDRAAAMFRLNRGCVCYPDDRRQALCMQHAVRATPLGWMELEMILDERWRDDLIRRFGLPRAEREGEMRG